MSTSCFACSVKPWIYLIEIVIARDLDEMFALLGSGEGDLIALGLTITAERRQKLNFTKALNVTHQVLVQRKPDNWRQMKLHEIENMMMRSPFDLDGETLVVRRASAYVDRLKNLALESGLEINIEESQPGLTTEDLISMVASGEIALTVADENIAQIQSAYYSNLDISTPLSLPQQTGWAVRPESPLLLEAINEWLTEAQQQADYYVIYNKYYKNRQAFRSRYADGYSQLKKGVVSPYDEMIRKEATRLGWDWRLLAALIYRESEFRPDARSWAGAAGLMQLMPATARSFGVEDPYNPAESITAGVDLLLWLDKYWQQHISDEEERLIFVLASYNVGQGHVQDARRLAEAFDANPDIWEKMLPVIC
jgi:membrane-bound lytic murein transglycosylase F